MRSTGCRNTDHPRSRGVYPDEISALCGECGSSPLARGLLRVRAGGLAYGGIIPARAGFTWWTWWTRPGTPDHPRSRGVYHILAGLDEHGGGSSPLARGLRERGRPRGMAHGIIPARAGFTPPTRKGTPMTTGSSPLARGLRTAALRRPHRTGIIPARAGFTRHRAPSDARSPDHPRSRGVYITATISAVRRYGSSPLARGLPGTRREAVRRAGIIPARAGFTSPPVRWSGGRRDHPRSRGVYYQAEGRLPAPDGSSPLARGLRCLASLAPFASRIIPARAGFTDADRGRRERVADHPRSRGVYPTPPTPSPAPAGSSPLARGLRRRRAGPRPQGRIIPARAGFTRVLRSSRLMRGDHPRSRGVYRGEVEERLLGRGSSPLARGLPRPGRGPRRAHEDHPRSRGVYLVAAGLDVESLGSSPLARGLQYAVMPATLVSGIIPARAGFTQHRPAQGLIRADHPRSRGVYAVFGAAWRQILGSSPLARGLRPVARRHLQVQRDHPRSRGVYRSGAAWWGGQRGSSPLARGLRQQYRAYARSPWIIPARAGFTIEL